MEVQLNKLFGMQDTPLGPVLSEESFGVWRVDVLDETLKGEPMMIPAGMLHVGTIGRQDGANFCANNSFRMFSGTQQEFIVSEVKRLHGSASPAAPVELTDLPEEDDEDDEEFDDTDLTDD